MIDQLSLLGPQQPQPPVTFEPTKGGLTGRCAFSGDAFGGLYTETEAASILQTLGLRSEPITPAEFGAAAAQAVRGVRR